MFSKGDFQRGALVDSWLGAYQPQHKCHKGKYVRLEPLHHAHITPLYEALCCSPEYDWYYMPFGPFADQNEFYEWSNSYFGKSDPLFFTIVNQDNNACAGFLSFLNVKPMNGSIEIGFIQFSQGLQRTTGATEAIWLLIKHAFELGYRRVEWKCDALNKRSRRAAKRLGFSFEGIFRQALVVKGRNRDTAWYSMTDKEWLDLAKIYDAWFAELISTERYTSLAELTCHLTQKEAVLKSV